MLIVLLAWTCGQKRQMRKFIVFIFTLAVISIACDESNTSPTTTSPPSPPALQISGFVSQFVIVPSPSGNYADINYEVTVTSNRATTGCFVRVQWLNETALQVGFTYAATGDVAIPAGTSKMTDQDLDYIATAMSIRDSRVVFSLCS